MKKSSVTIESGRYFLTDRIRGEVDFSATAQSRGENPPPVQKGMPDGAVIVPLPSRHEWRVPPCDLLSAIGNRQSHRKFINDPLSLAELSLLLWATQGVRAEIGTSVLRTVPSAGCRHPFETYIAALNIVGLGAAIYRYLPLDHELVLVNKPPNLRFSLAAGAHGQRFVAQAAACFIWTAIPARTEWRYGEASHKVIALDAGHICQNLYLACEAIRAGTCAVAAYRQDLMDELVGVDGYEEFTVYLAPVGKVEEVKG